MGKENQMTKQHFIRAAEIVKSIRDGNWSNELPRWADGGIYNPPYADRFSTAENYTRAVQTAEAFLHLFKEYNPRFDERRFLSACGLLKDNIK